MRPRADVSPVQHLDDACTVRCHQGDPNQTPPMQVEVTDLGGNIEPAPNLGDERRNVQPLG
jgi:hypothetical protein